ncbi:hypothetical protein [Mesorhizobium sp. M1322]|uniref:hypothetical protein n=1 Tax=Mesorhizobium sp. M1322 TaxID=2957081 RepID=UPI00333A9D07
MSIDSAKRWTKNPPWRRVVRRKISTSGQINGMAAVIEPAATLASKGQSTDFNLIKIAGTISQRLSFGLKLLESRTWQNLRQNEESLLQTPYGS